ncbi:MAG: HD-GYP domain-containing protein, partial [Deltaproteobacteria bacterium]
MGILENNIEIALKDIIASLQTAKLYSTQHAIFKNSVGKAYSSLQSVLKDRPELIIGIIGEELAFEKEIFFDLSKSITPVIAYFKERGIERIVFYSALEEEELGRFIAFLSEFKEDVGRTPQEYLAAMGVRNISVGKIRIDSVQDSLSSEGGQSGKINYPGLYGDYHDRFTQSMETMLDDETVDYVGLKLAVNNVIEGLSSRHQELLKLATIKRYDVGTFSHIINVSILAMYFSARLGFGREAVMEIGIAGLFHDIGKLYISRKIINKQDKLTDEEFEKIKSHSAVGAEILLKYVDALGILPVVVTFEHHLRYDLKGYPKLTFTHKPHIASFIVSICDVYDALLQRRSYKSDYSSEMIYDFMQKEKGRLFEPSLLDSFYKIMGVWPIGTIVVLNDARIAVVRHE